MKPLNKKEILIIGAVLLVILTLSYFNLRVALRRARDFQRKDDINNIANALFLFKEDFGFYPSSSADGKIVACGTDVYVECRWGWDALTDISDPAYQPYLARLPADPQNQLGASYRYVSTLKNFQVFAALEGKDEDEYNVAVESRGFICGSRTCNFGKGSSGVPLDKTLEEYENEIDE